MSYLGVDIGGTASRYVLADAAGTLIARLRRRRHRAHLQSPRTAKA
ncbi:hypothetical protein N8D56_00040 [Devosia sp. A8/3-2]|nr:hypothetical protein N8D56_00040 [Devosia sp. A8/3-2]